MLTFDQAQLRAILGTLDKVSSTAFALACAQRCVAQRWTTAAHPAAALEAFVVSAWKYLHAGDIESLREQIRSTGITFMEMPGLEESELLESVCAVFCELADGVATTSANESEVAYLVYEIADNFASDDMVRSEEAGIPTVADEAHHPLVQAELQRQKRDLDLLVQHGSASFGELEQSRFTDRNAFYLGLDVDDY